MKLTEKEYYFIEFEKIIKRNPKPFKIIKTEYGFYISKNSAKYLDTFIILFITFGIPIICLFFLKDQKYLLIIWVLVFSWRFYKILINENKMIFDFKEMKIKMENSSLIGKIFIPDKEFNFNEILKSSLELKTERFSNYSKIVYQLYLEFKNRRKIKILNFNDEDIGKRFKQLINGMIRKL